MHAFALALGLAVLGAAWIWPIPSLIPGSFSGHMAAHMAVVAAAAPLLALGIAGGALDPVRKAPAWFPPVPASVVELVVVWVWHAPELHGWARRISTGLVLEQASFLAGGLWVWLAVLGGDPRGAGGRRAAGVVALLLTSMHMTLLGALLALAPRPLYVHSHGAHDAVLKPLEDQHLGGAIMLLAGGVSYLAGGLLVSARLLRGARGRRLGEPVPASEEP